MEDKETGGEFGNVDAFGLDEFGQVDGLNPLWGAAVGAGVGTLSAIAIRQFTKMGKWSELIGLGLGAASSGAMIIFPGTRAAGWAGLAASFLNNGLRQLELMMFAPKVPLLGDVVIEPAQALMGGQFGLVDIERTQALLGQAEAGADMPTLVGAGVGNASDHIQLVGGPALSQVASHWGATHFSGRA